MNDTSSAAAKEDSAKERFNAHAEQIEALGDFWSGGELTPDAIEGMSATALYALHGPNGRRHIADWMKMHEEELERAGNVRHGLVPDVEWEWADASLQEILGALRLNLANDEQAKASSTLKQQLDDRDRAESDRDSIMSSVAALGLVLGVIILVAIGGPKASPIAMLLLALFITAMGFVSLIGHLRSERTKRQLAAREGDYAKRNGWAWS